MLGHLFPIFLGFKGGKGVATFLGTLLALSFPVGLAACAAWAVTAAIFRISSLSALVSAGLAPVFTIFFYHWHGAIIVAIMSVIIFFKHSANIKRLRDGSEPKIGQKT
jgi:glycerol-3-phosphate acyltransferase PlsY